MSRFWCTYSISVQTAPHSLHLHCIPILQPYTCTFVHTYQNSDSSPSHAIGLSNGCVDCTWPGVTYTDKSVYMYSGSVLPRAQSKKGGKDWIDNHIKAFQWPHHRTLGHDRGGGAPLPPLGESLQWTWINQLYRHVQYAPRKRLHNILAQEVERAVPLHSCAADFVVVQKMW